MIGAARLMAAAALLSAPLPALALSCMPFTPMHGWHETAASPDIYVFVTGTLRFDRSRLPKYDPSQPDRDPPTVRLPARIEGLSLTRSGLNAAFSSDVTLVAGCMGIYCPEIASDERRSMFLRRDPDIGYVLTVDPCSSYIWSPVNTAVIDQFLSCLNGRYCPKP